MRLVGADGEQIGVVASTEALRMARELDLDLVEVAPQANPPVCRIMDYGKFKYERDIRQKEARKKQSRTELKEIKFRPKIDAHDYGTKKGHVERFLRGGHKVKVTIMFRGREMTHTDLGRKLLDRLVGRPRRDGDGGVDAQARRPEHDHGDLAQQAVHGAARSSDRRSSHRRSRAGAGPRPEAEPERDGAGAGAEPEPAPSRSRSRSPPRLHRTDEG